MRGLARNFASTYQVGNSAGISKVGENKQLLIAIVVVSFFYADIGLTLICPPIAFKTFIIVPN
ncbi:hypothetical protein FNB79_12150 [Formosa sediminum]|uniref:Uncharacterized protein n=1 Tax=Formosa sediminum TaxID=2594004 RepID=A0A516GT44_9FLAO|nr:hypothetical protein FNB79_12150 [Formosa sediminum]